MTLGWQTETEQTPESCSAELSASPRDWLTLFHEPDELNLWIVLVGVVSFTGDLKQSVHFNIKHSKRPFSVLNIWVISVKLCVIKVCKSALIPTTYHIVLFENTDGSFFDFMPKSSLCCFSKSVPVCPVGRSSTGCNNRAAFECLWLLHICKPFWKPGLKLISI